MRNIEIPDVVVTLVIWGLPVLIVFVTLAIVLGGGKVKVTKGQASFSAKFRGFFAQPSQNK